MAHWLSSTSQFWRTLHSIRHEPMSRAGESLPREPFGRPTDGGCPRCVASDHCQLGSSASHFLDEIHPFSACNDETNNLNQLLSTYQAPQGAALAQAISFGGQVQRGVTTRGLQCSRFSGWFLEIMAMDNSQNSLVGGFKHFLQGVYSGSYGIITNNNG